VLPARLILGDNFGKKRIFNLSNESYGSNTAQCSTEAQPALSVSGTRNYYSLEKPLIH